MIVRNLLNLVTNAVKHTVRGEIHVAAGFKVFLDRPGTVFIEFKVSDTGTGICKEYRGANSETVWMPFESGAKSTGLGLFVVKRSLIILLVHIMSDCCYINPLPHATLCVLLPHETAHVALVCEATSLSHLLSPCHNLPLYLTSLVSDSTQPLWCPFLITPLPLLTSLSLIIFRVE